MSQKVTLYQEYPEFPKAAPPIAGNWDSAHTSIGAGVAIFHLASGRVVLCYHSTRGSYFLPKGRRDANEDTGPGAEREGFEEVSTLHKWDLNTMRKALTCATVRLPQPPSPSSHTHQPTQSAQSLSIQRSIFALRHRARLDPIGASLEHSAVHAILVHS